MRSRTSRSPRLWLVWPILVLAAGLFYRGPAPWHSNWDNFAYLDAALTGKGFVPLGFGRPLFCGIGKVFAPFSRNMIPADPFAIYRVWSGIGVLFFAASLALLLRALARRFGDASALAFGAFCVLHTESLELWMEVWPENWARALGFVCVSCLLVRSHRRRTWLAASLAAALAMVWIKETAVPFVPGLAVIVFATQSGSLRRRFAVAFGWLAVAGLAGGLFHLVTPFLVDGLAEAQRDWLAYQYKGDEAVVPGLDQIVANTNEIARTLWLSPWHVAFAGAGLAFGVATLVRRRSFDAVFWTVASACTMIAGAWAFVTVSGATIGMARYSREFAPALGMLAIVPLLPRGGSARRATTGQRVFAVAMAVVFAATFNTGQMRWRTESETNDYRRYLAMQTLRYEPIALIAGNDAWAAHFVQSHTVSGQENHRWAILWGTEADGFPTQAWIDEQQAAGRRFAVHDSVPPRAGLSMEEYCARLPGTYAQHTSGWTIRQSAE